MQETKLIILLKAFEPDDLKSLDKFLKSPYFNTNSTIISFWDYLKKYAPQFESSQLSQEKTYKKLFPKKVFNEKKLRQLRSRLFKLVEEFLAIESFRQNEFEVKSTIANAYRKKGMKDDFEKRYEHLKADFSSEVFLNAEELHQKLNIHHQLYFSELNVKGDTYPKNLAESTRLLDQYYIQQKLFYAIEWFSSKLRYNHTIPPNIVAFAKALKSNDEFADTIQSIFANCVKLLVLEEDSADFFIALKEQFTRNYTKINGRDKNLLLRLLINFCIINASKGKNTTKDTFNLYQLGLSDEAIFYKGKLTNISFLNIIGTAIKLEELEWAINFIKKESPRLYEVQKEIYLSIAKASIYFYQQKYKDCLMLLSNMETNNIVLMEILKRGLKLRAIFECYLKDKNYLNLIHSTLESYAKFLNRKDILSNTKRNAYLNFVKFTKRLVTKIEKGVNPDELAKMKMTLSLETVIPYEYKKWLLGHIDQLSNP